MEHRMAAHQKVHSLRHAAFPICPSAVATIACVNRVAIRKCAVLYIAKRSDSYRATTTFFASTSHWFFTKNLLCALSFSFCKDFLRSLPSFLRFGFALVLICAFGFPLSVLCLLLSSVSKGFAVAFLRISASSR